MEQYIVDAFTDRVFGGNQAAVCVMRSWPGDGLMQDIARENNFSETAFAVREGEAYRLRWFTPGGEIDFCGHATLGASYVLLNHYEKAAEEIVFNTQVGQLSVRRRGSLYEMDFPAYALDRIPVTQQMAQAIGVRPLEAYIDRDLLLVLPDAAAVEALKPDQEKLKALEGTLVVVTSPASEAGVDCVSRIFAPKLCIPEDPVTGSTHCMITPYWCGRLGKDALVCRQASARGGTLYTRLVGNRVRVAGSAVLYSKGVILENE